MNILFWSGGKDAYLAYEFYRRDFPDTEVKLLTTYNEQTDIVPHQKIPIKNIRKQAEALDLEIITIALPEECPNAEYLKRVNQALNKQEASSLIFGDWKLQDIRQWREEQFRELGFDCIFPIWEKPLDELLPVLLLKPVEVQISAVDDEYKQFIKIAEKYNQQFIRQLPDEIDPMGEKGEFHTEVIFKNWDDEREPIRQPLF